MFKKLSVMLMVAVIIFSFCIPAAANNSTSGNEADEAVLAGMITDKSLKATSQFLVTITRPEGDETTFRKSYAICGTSDKTDIQVVLARYDKETDTYKEFKNTDGQSRWDIGSFGLFSKEVLLSEGANRLKIMAYKKSEIGSLKPEENLQINYFTVTALNENIKDKIINSVVNITNVLKDFLQNSK